jgi:hypothetical protein
MMKNCVCVCVCVCPINLNPVPPKNTKDILQNRTLGIQGPKELCLLKSLPSVCARMAQVLKMANIAPLTHFTFLSILGGKYQICSCSYVYKISKKIVPHVVGPLFR